jgi:hypothetical protein
MIYRFALEKADLRHSKLTDCLPELGLGPFHADDYQEWGVVLHKKGSRFVAIG